MYGTVYGIFSISAHIADNRSFNLLSYLVVDVESKSVNRPSKKLTQETKKNAVSGEFQFSTSARLQITLN